MTLSVCRVCPLHPPTKLGGTTRLLAVPPALPSPELRASFPDLSGGVLGTPRPQLS